MLGKIVNNEQRLNKYGLIVKQEIKNIPKIRKECVVDKFVVMPNHLHLIVQFTEGDNVGDDGNRPAGSVNHRADCHPPLRKTISNMVQGLKGAITRQIGFSLWQRSFHDRIIRNEADYHRIWQYIDENPAKWTEDRYYNQAGG